MDKGRNMLTQAQLDARKQGGINRAKKYTHEQLSDWSSLGGRPRRQLSPVLQSAPEAKFIGKEVNLASVSFNKLKGLVKKLYPEMFNASPG
jgi:hypothetical protein